MGGKCVGACSVEGCGKPVLARKLCSMHYYRVTHHGDVGSADSVRPGGTCTIDDCKRPHKGRGYCNMHLKRLRSTGDPTAIRESGRPLSGDVPGWAAVHKRIHRLRGRAADRQCVDCGGAAQEWSYDGTDPHELIGPAHGFMLSYSLSPDHYQPRCVSCHRKFDTALRVKPGATIRYEKDARAHFEVTITELLEGGANL